MKSTMTSMAVGSLMGGMVGSVAGIGLVGGLYTILTPGGNSNDGGGFTGIANIANIGKMVSGLSTMALVSGVHGAISGGIGGGLYSAFRIHPAPPPLYTLFGNPISVNVDSGIRGCGISIICGSIAMVFGGGTIAYLMVDNEDSGSGDGDGSGGTKPEPIRKKPQPLTI
jgi:hypothetical protein